MTADARLRIGILLADHVREEFQPQFGDYPDMFEAMLRAAAGDRPLSFSVYDVQQGRYPQCFDECDGYVISGSRDSVYDDAAWIAELSDYVRALHSSRTRTIGICFGHQLIAHALGGETRPAQAGWGVGVHASRVVAPQAWMQGAPAATFNLLCSHKDQVVALPNDATLVASSEFCRNAAFVLGEHLITFQGHPEFTKPYAEALMKWRRELLGAAYEPGMASLGTPEDAVRVGRWMLDFIAG